MDQYLNHIKGQILNNISCLVPSTFCISSPTNFSQRVLNPTMRDKHTFLKSQIYCLRILCYYMCHLQYSKFKGLKVLISCPMSYLDCYILLGKIPVALNSSMFFAHFTQKLSYLDKLGESAPMVGMINLPQAVVPKIY